MCSWDEKASSKIQKALEQEILTFIGDAQKVGRTGAAVVHVSRSQGVVTTIPAVLIRDQPL